VARRGDDDHDDADADARQPRRGVGAARRAPTPAALAAPAPALREPARRRGWSGRALGAALAGPLAAAAAAAQPAPPPTAQPAPPPAAQPAPPPAAQPAPPAAPASARPATDPRALFGLRDPAAGAGGAPARCSEGPGFGCALAGDPLDDAAPAALRTRLPSSYLRRLPVADLRHDAVAGFALAAGRDDFGASFGGATGLETAWTIEGAPAESLRTGALETRVPLELLSELVVVAGGFAARDRASTGGTVDARLIRGGDRHTLEARAWTTLYSRADRERPIPRATYQLRRIALAPRGEATVSAVATGPLPRVRGGRAWYAAGVAPNLGTTDVRWRTATLADADRDGVPDGLPGVVATRPILARTEAVSDYFVPALARAGWARGPHDVAVSLVGNAVGDSVFFAQATPRAAGIDRRTWIGDAIAAWRGTWRGTRAQARVAWHRSARRESARDPAGAAAPQLQAAYIPGALPDEPALGELCDDRSPADAVPTLTNCPVPIGFFFTGGAGLLTDAVADRPSAAVDATHRRGNHVLRAGVALEDSRIVQTARFTGGELVRSLFDGHADRQRFLGGACQAEPGAPCAYASESVVAYRTRYTAAYLEDTYELAPGLSANAGLRWELMWVGPHLHLSRQLAPRLGLAWDLLGRPGGARGAPTARLSATLGRSFVMLPAGMGPTVIARPRSVRDVDSPIGQARTIDEGGVVLVADGIEPAAQDEGTLGLELGVPGAARAAVWVAGRSLRRGYDTVGVDPVTGEVELDNPGRTGGLPASRSSTTLAVEVATDPAARTVARAGYAWGRAVGTWVGPADPRQGAQLYASSDWDGDSTNYLGRLPTDAGHRAFVEGERRGRLGGVDVGVALRVTVASGRPRSVLGQTDVGLAYLLPRGSAGRAPLLSQANLRVGATWRGFAIALDVFNLLDRQAATSFDEVYAGPTVQPIDGGSAEDLVFLKTPEGTAAPRRSAFRLPSAFQAPIAATLGLSRAL
jgi:hypothetical protein